MFRLSCLAVVLLAGGLSAQDEIRLPKDPRAAIAAMPIATPLEAGVLLTLVNGKDGTPVANATVLAGTYPPRPQLTKLMDGWTGDNADIDLAIASQYSKRYATNERGQVRIPESSVYWIMTRSDVHRDLANGDKTVRLFEPKTLTVRVLQANGKPARGVRVRANARSRSSMDKTNSDGIAKITLDGQTRSRSDTFTLDVDILTRDALTKELDHTKPIEEPVEFRLPPMGQLRFILYGEDERPSETLESVSLQLDSPVRYSRRSQRGPGFSYVFPTNLESDSALYAYVPLGEKFVVRASRRGTRQSLTFRGKGPTRPRELVVIEGRINVGPPLLRFRVLGKDGEPLANTEVGCAFRKDTERSGTYTYNIHETDADGRLELGIRKGAYDTLYVVHRGPADDKGSRSYEGCAIVDLPDLQPGPQSMDDVQLGDDWSITRVRAMDADGKPVSGVWVRGTMSLATMAGKAGGGGGSGSDSYFAHIVRTDRDGWFEIREARPIGERWAFSVLGGSHYVPRTSWPQLGKRKQEALLLRTAPVTIQATPVQPGMPRMRIELRHGESDYAMRGETDDKGTLTVSNAPVGIYEIRVDDELDSVALSQVVVEAPTSDDEPVPLTVDWRKYFRWVRGTIVDKKQRPLAHARISYRVPKPGGGSSGTAGWSDQNGVVNMFLPLKANWFQFGHEGYATKPLDKLEDGFTVVAETIEPVVIEYEGLPKLSGPFQYSISPTRRMARMLDRSSAAFLKGKATIDVTVLGKGTASLQLTVPYNATRGIPRADRNQIQRLARDTAIKTEFESRSEPGPPVQRTLTEAEITAFQEAIEKIQAILDEHKDG